MGGINRPDGRRRLTIHGYPTWLVAAVTVALLVLPWVIVLALARHHHLDATAVAVLAAVSIPLAGLWVAWVTLVKGGGSGVPVSGLSIDQVVDQLAIAVGAQWSAEADKRRLDDPYPLPVSWFADASLTGDWDLIVRLASGGGRWPAPPPAGTWAVGPDELAGKDDEVAEVLAMVPTGRLVVLGEPGTGKTMLMIRLVLDLLARRDPGGPVPILASVASWNPAEQDLRGWLAGQLMIDHPALAGRPAEDRAESTLADGLLASGLIIAVLDGLDEIPEEVRGPAVSRINDALRPGEQVVVTCRSKEYREAVRPEGGGGIEAAIRGAAVVELRLLDADDVRRYLYDDAVGAAAKARWTPVFEVLGAKAPAGEALSTPLMVGLARAIYNPRPGELAGALRDPAELCDPELPGPEAVESLLFDAFVPAAYRPVRATRWRTENAVSWLEYIAVHLERTIASPDLAWWHLRRAVPRISFRLATVVGLALLVALVFFAAAGPGPAVGPLFGLWNGIWVGLRLGFTLGLLVGLAVGFFFGSDSADARSPGRGRRSEAPSRGMRVSTAELASGSVFGLLGGIALGLVFGLQGGGLGAGLGAALGCGLAVGFGYVLGSSLQAVPGNLTMAASPQVVLARDRRTALLLLLTGGLVTGLGIGLGFGLTSDYGLVTGLVGGLAAGLVVGGTQTAWPSYTFSRGWLAFRRHLPWSLMSFLEDAHQRGILRQVGAVYQFRHIELQRRLANRDATKEQTSSSIVLSAADRQAAPD